MRASSEASKQTLLSNIVFVIMIYTYKLKFQELVSSDVVEYVDTYGRTSSVGLTISNCNAMHCVIWNLSRYTYGVICPFSKLSSNLFSNKHIPTWPWRPPNCVGDTKHPSSLPWRNKIIVQSSNCIHGWASGEPSKQTLFSTRLFLWSCIISETELCEIPTVSP